MKKIIVFMLLIIGCLEGMAQNPGDSLALLYRRVYVYKNPDELSTRLKTSPYSYNSTHKLTYITTDKKYSRYYKILTPEGDTAYVRSKMVSADQSLTHAQIREEVDQGIRSKDPGKKVHKSETDLPRWATWAIFLGIIGLLILFWVKFKKIDSWFCNKNSPNTKKLRSAWFIKFSVIPGVVIGAIELFSPKEYKWFKQEGFQLWGSYPSTWDWIMWAAAVSVVFVAIGAVIQSFHRFKPKMAVYYALFSLAVIAVYFSVGMLVGALVAVFFFLGSGGSGSGDNEPVGATTVINGQTYTKAPSGDWVHKY